MMLPTSFFPVQILYILLYHGIQETRIICMKKNSQLVVTDDNCDLMEKPTPQVISCNIEPCPVQWVVGNWSACSVTCGEGIQTRSAECKKRISPSYYLWVSATACLFSPRPPTTKKCKNKPCAEWRIGEWGKCSAECGHGQRTREVRCVNVEDVEISDTHCTETRPATEEICDMGSCAKAWFYTSWSKECSTPCGKGVLTRKVFCSADDGTSLPDSRCNTSEKPHTEKSCKNTQPCGGMWFTGNWSPCTATCSNGFRIRDVACVKRLGSGLYTVVTEENCLSTSKPSGKEPCATLPSCPPDWYLTEWAECSASCGTGYRSREVKCMDENLEFSALCSNEKKPITRQTCNSYSCHRPQLDSDPGCKDKLGYCKLVVQARLCPYKYYKERCCESCKDYS